MLSANRVRASAVCFCRSDIAEQVFPESSLHKDFPSISFRNWGKTIKKLLSQSICFAGTRVVYISLAVPPGLTLQKERPLCAYHHTQALFTKCRSVAPTEKILRCGDDADAEYSVGFALRSPLGSAFSYCNLTVCSSLRCKYQSLLLSLKGLWYI